MIVITNNIQPLSWYHKVHMTGVRIGGPSFCATWATRRAVAAISPSLMTFPNKSAPNGPGRAIHTLRDGLGVDGRYLLRNTRGRLLD